MFVNIKYFLSYFLINYCSSNRVNTGPILILLGYEINASIRIIIRPTAVAGVAYMLHSDFL